MERRQIRLVPSRPQRIRTHARLGSFPGELLMWIVMAVDPHRRLGVQRGCRGWHSGGGGGGGTWCCSEWLCLSILNMSRNPLMPNLDILRFLPSVDACAESSEGRVTVLLIASPHRQCRFMPVTSIGCALSDVDSTFLSMSYSKTSCH